MRHIARVLISRYRSIVRADLRLGEVTTIVGASDSGKSNCLRALRDWAYGATGTDFISRGSVVARVAVASGRHRIVWEKTDPNKPTRRNGKTSRKGTGAMRYVHEDAGTGKYLSYERIGNTSPEEVRAVTGFREVVVDEDLKLRINFAEQGDPWFLLASPPWTPGIVTRVVAKIAGLDSLVLAGKALVRERATIARGERSCTAKGDAHRRALAEDFVGLDAALAAVDGAERAEAERADAESRIRRASDLLEASRVRRERLDATRARSEAGRRSLAAIDALDFPAEAERFARAIDALRLVERVQERREETSARLARLANDLAAALAELRALADDGGLRCPLCGGSAHGECRELLRGLAVPQVERRKR